MLRRLFAVARTIVVAILFVSIWLWFLPRWMGMRYEVQHRSGWVVFAIGAAIMIRCCWEFAWRGLGTPAPFDPPRKLVVTGLYRWMRNPMYTGLLFALLGQAVLYESAIPLIVLAIAGAFFVPLVLFYEEPHLREAFGADYEAYCRAVPRWLPTRRPAPGARSL